MLHILLIILKIIGILLLIILGLLLFLLLLILFFPISYRIRGRKEDASPEGRAGITWLFGLFKASISYQESKTKVSIRIFGISLERLQWIRQKRTEKKMAKARDKRRPKWQEALPGKIDLPVEKTQESTLPARNTEPSPASDVIPDQTAPGKTKTSFIRRLRNVLLKILGIPGRVLSKIRNFKLTLQNICDKMKQWNELFHQEATKEAVAFLKQMFGRLLVHIRPRKAVGYLKYGFDDPARTGEALGLLSLLFPVHKTKVKIIPVFEEEALAFRLSVKGRVYGCFFAKMAISIFRNKSVRMTIRVLRHKED